jgi:hypothetical protein
MTRHEMAVDVVERKGNWLFFADVGGDHRWYVHLGDVVAVRFDVGDGRLVLQTATRTFEVTGEGHDDEFAFPNAVEDLLYRYFG